MVFGGWLRGVARNHYRNWVRSRGRRRARFVPLDPESLVAAAPTDSETADQVRRAIARLPARQREVVWMHYLEATSVLDVAALLGVSPKTVEGRLYQARRNLRRLLDDGQPAAVIGGFFLCL